MSAPTIMVYILLCTLDCHLLSDWRHRQSSESSIRSHWHFNRVTIGQTLLFNKSVIRILDPQILNHQSYCKYTSHQETTRSFLPAPFLFHLRCDGVIEPLYKFFSHRLQSIIVHAHDHNRILRDIEVAIACQHDG
jgi:hypothetical protein